ncbi:MDR family MFS transporter [Paenisporosarcina antarctica]|uniref:DHA2 family efflux MFS transporter permease subunit n=1 Tax=Paenisporosarcina antarctica TaxID=417367 RepID=A0A4P7A3U7_9BACL|nr:MDR family MFS transporter [Paenisporosarcina antarctica]QBP42736.1 DHA2 family efflux MFS transporter permease subunit [Paenisporosarcina antarctica]
MTEQKKPPYGIVAILFTGAFVTIFTQTLLNIALPSIMTDLKIEAATAQWLITGYMLVNGILIPASAYFIQRYSNRAIFILAMSLFVLGTLIAGLAPTFGVLLAARMIQASGSALMMPLLMNVILVAFPIERRGSAMGIFGLVMIVAPAIGPTLSGYIVEHYSWRVLFLVILPLALIPLALGIFKLKNLTFQNKELTLDKMSLVFSSLGFGGILYGFSAAGQNGWSDLYVLGTITIGVVSLVTFIFRQFKLKDPLLEFRIYKYPMFALSSAISIAVSISMFSGMIIMPIYVQTIKGISPVDSGLLMLPGALLMGFMSPVTGKLFDKYGAKILAISGMSIIVISTYFFSDLSTETTYLQIMAIYTIRMLGISMVMMPVMTNGLNTLPIKAYPHGTAMNNTLQQVSGAIGSALLITVMNTRTTAVAKDLAISGADPSSIMKNSMMEGINYTFFISTFIAAIALLLTFFIKKPKRPETEEEKDIVDK